MSNDEQRPKIVDEIMKGVNKFIKESDLNAETGTLTVRKINTIEGAYAVAFTLFINEEQE